MEIKTTQSNFSQYTAVQADQVLADLGVDPAKGLSTQQAHERKQKFGSNAIVAQKTTIIQMFLRQLASPFIYILLGVALISFFFKNHWDGIVILVVVLLNTLIGFYQEYKADRAIALLKKYLRSYATVIRGAKEVDILQEDIVPGDIVVLMPGDKIPADVRFIQTFNVLVDESLLTGESQPVVKDDQPLQQPVTELFKAHNIGFAGTTITRGKAKAVVIATGSESSIGAIAALTSQTERVTIFAKVINRFSTIILYAMILSIFILFVMNIIIKKGNVDFIELILFSAALAVSIVPEALPLVTTFALSQGALHLVKKKMVVKRLSSIEDLGNIEILCTDKTGTLTENRMTVGDVFGDRDAVLYTMSLAGTVSAQRAGVLKGFDLALFNALSTEQRKALETVRMIKEFPFDPHRRLDSVLIKLADGSYQIIMRGAFEVVHERCGSRNGDDYTPWVQSIGLKGYRILAVAKQNVDVSNEASFEFSETDTSCTIIGAVAFDDPLKDTAIMAIKKAQRFGIQCKIISGDAPEVCGAIGKKIGLIPTPQDVMTGALLEQAHEREQKKIVHSYHVFARVSPEQKAQIIQLLQEDHEVGYLGDGINDAPALKQAGVALAVQDAADIAREASDIILLEKSLMVIINGIIEGRKIFTNTLKYLRTTLSANFGNFYAIAISSLLIDYLPMLPVQILLLNLLSDAPLIAFATDNVSEKKLERGGEQFDVKGIITLAVVLGMISTIFDFIFFALFYKKTPAVLQTAWFIGSVLTEMAFVFSIRTTHFFFKGSRPSALLSSLIVVASCAALLIPYTIWGDRIFGFVCLPSIYLAWIIGVVIVYFITTDIIKTFFLRAYTNGKKS